MTHVDAGRLRPALLNPCFWPEVRRGSERFVRDLADGLIARGHAPTLITSHRGAPSVTEEEGLRVVRVPRPPDRWLRRRAFEDHMAHVPLSYAALRLDRYDLAHPLFMTDAQAAIRWARRSGRPVVFSHMGIPGRRYLVSRRRRLDLMVRATRGADATVALSRVAATAFERDLGVDARMIHPGVDLEAFSPGGCRADGPTLFCAADLTIPRKRVMTLLAAARQARREVPALRVVLARPRDPRTAATIGLREPWVELRDVDDRERLVDAYREAWVSALPSRDEGFGLVLAESLACGTPVVGARDGGIPEVVGEDGAVGRLFDSGEDPEQALTRALLDALELARDPTTPAACRRQAERFPIERCIDAYEGLYRELIRSVADSARR